MSLIVVFDITKNYVVDSSLGLKALRWLFLGVFGFGTRHFEYWVDKYNKLKYMSDFWGFIYPEVLVVMSHY